MRGSVARQHEIHHQVDDVAWREVLARVLVQCLVELADQLLEDRAHGGVVDRVGMEIHRLEALEHLEEQARLIELADRVVEAESLEHLAHVLAKAGDMLRRLAASWGASARSLSKS